jgi:hypothetical protein
MGRGGGRDRTPRLSGGFYTLSKIIESIDFATWHLTSLGSTLPSDIMHVKENANGSFSCYKMHILYSVFGVPDHRHSFYGRTNI